MAKKQPNRSPAYIVHARLEPRLGAAYEAYLNSLRPRPTSKAALSLIIEEFLVRNGFLAADDQAESAQDDDPPEEEPKRRGRPRKT